MTQVIVSYHIVESNTMRMLVTQALVLEALPPHQYNAPTFRSTKIQYITVDCCLRETLHSHSAGSQSLE